MSEPGLLTHWARLLVGSLRAAGVEDAVLSPGSRSTPFTWAVLQEPGLRHHTIIDERSAGFFAVGMARVTGRPVALLCTSGSAAANYFPAVVEAAEAAIPLLLVTADRPFELQHAAAPQTIDQTRLYGRFARAYFDLGMPDPEPAMLRAVQRVAAQAVHTTRTPLPGPVQLNVRARKPLEPVADDDSPVASLVDRLLADGPTRVSAAPATPPRAAVAELAEACRWAERGLIVCGPAAPWQAASPELVADLARATGFPVVPEASSQQRFATEVADGVAGNVLDAFPTLLEAPAFRRRRAPDLILHIGRPPTASAWNAALAGWDGVRRYVVWPWGWADPWGSASMIVQADLDATLRSLLTILGDQGAPGSDVSSARARWLRTLREDNGTAWSAINTVTGQGFGEGAAVRAVWEGVPDGSILALGNSLPIRHADTFMNAAPRKITVWSQRGANGIDGLISGAAGAAAAAAAATAATADAGPATGARRPVTLLLGDVSCLHDLGGLAVARESAVPLNVVVLNNGGGRIFERLPIAKTAGDAFRSWITPPGVDFEAAARAFGIPFRRCGSANEIAGAMADGDRQGQPGCRLLEVTIPADTTTGPHREIVRRIDAELSAR